jgi:transcriptional regulator with GAF, ATPase, and Fis domain
VLDELRDAEQRVVKRLKELEPAVAEYRELEEVAQRLGLDATAEQQTAAEPATAQRRSVQRTRGTAATAAAKTETPSRPKRSARAGRTTASAGQRREQLLALVRERPGITVAEAGKEFGIDPTSLYRVVRRLEEGGEVRKNGPKLEPVNPTV